MSVAAAEGVRVAPAEGDPAAVPVTVAADVSVASTVPVATAVAAAVRDAPTVAVSIAVEDEERPGEALREGKGEGEGEPEARAEPLGGRDAEPEPLPLRVPVALGDAEGVLLAAEAECTALSEALLVSAGELLGKPLPRTVGEAEPQPEGGELALARTDAVAAV